MVKYNQENIEKVAGKIVDVAVVFFKSSHNFSKILLAFSENFEFK